MAKITIRKVTHDAGDDRTFLLPYVHELIKLIEYKNGRIDIQLEDGEIINHVEGEYVSECNEYNYTIKKLLSKPLNKKLWEFYEK